MTTTTTESGLQIEEVRVGDGDVATAGQFIRVHYAGWLTGGFKSTPVVIATSRSSFPLGARNVIAGWDEGVQGMRVGGVRKLTIPPRALATGHGAPVG